MTGQATTRLRTSSSATVCSPRTRSKCCFSVQESLERSVQSPCTISPVADHACTVDRAQADEAHPPRRLQRPRARRIQRNYLFKHHPEHAVRLLAHTPWPCAYSIFPRSLSPTLLSRCSKISHLILTLGHPSTLRFINCPFRLMTPF